MKLGKSCESLRTVLYCTAVLGLAAFGLWFGASANDASAKSSAIKAPSAVFNGTGVGPIPDGGSGCSPSPGAPLNVSFNVTGMGASPTNLSVSMTFGSTNHSFVGDVVATLIAPNGTSFTVFGRTLATTATAFGDSSDLGGTYVFNDAAATPPSGGWWQEATLQGTTTVLTPGTYRTTQLGGAGTPNPAPATSMNPAFAAAPANGTWTLRFTDGCSADTGAVTAAALTVESAVVNPAIANVDFDGDGKSDYSIARATTTPLSEAVPSTEYSLAFDTEDKLARLKRKSDPNAIAPPIWWYNKINGSTATSVQQWGDAATDFLVPSDYDGDRKSDYAIWRPGAPNTAAFFILQSTTNTLRTETFGQTGDDPAVIGDYDGDQKADVATFRCPAFGAGDGQCYFFYRGSLNNPSGNITYVPWGFGEDGDFFPLLGDFDGDGKFDFNLQRAMPGATTLGEFVLLKSGGGVEFFQWGLSSDFLIPGDYDGDGKWDFCVRRTVSGARKHFIKERDGGGSANYVYDGITFGITNDASTPGDYDGDGKTDLAVWRPNADPDQNFFWVLNSSNGSVTQLEWGAQNDVAVASWPVK